MRLVTKFQHLIHKHFIWIVSGSYVAAALFPNLGLSIRHIYLGVIEAGPISVSVTAPSVLLALLLFNAGLGTRARELRKLAQHPRLLALGVTGNVIVPLLFIGAIGMLMRLWHNADEVQQILTGLALIAAMPIAGASSAWAQNANGDLALSLSLILLTTLLSPILTPAVLHAVGFVTSGDYAEDLHELASDGAGSFLTFWVILPSCLGLAAHAFIGEGRAALVSPYVKMLNFSVLIVLNYSNAALSLPKVLAQPDLDFLAAILIIVGSLCLVMFGAAYAISRRLRMDRGSSASMMFGLGMNNNGAGLVLASLTMSDHPGVMLPIIIYNLFQHFVASLVDRVLFRGNDDHSSVPV